MQGQQRTYWLKDLQTGKEIKVKDSSAAVAFLDSLAQHNFYFTEVQKVEDNNNKITISFDKGINYNKAHIIPDQQLRNDLRFPEKFRTNNLDSLKNTILKYYKEEGYSFSRVKTKFRGMHHGTPQVEINIAMGKKRTIDGFEVRGYERVPKRFVKNFEKEFTHQTYKEDILPRISRSLQNHPFVSVEQPPQTLFSQDSTKVFLFLNKKKSNTFDGIIGFGNDENEKFSFNGSLNVNFRNIFNGFETINVFWQRNPDKGQTFDLRTDIPYLFSSNIGLDVNVNIYRQDSTFVNVKFLPGAYFHLNNRQKIGLRGTLETSAVLDSLYTLGRDYNKSGIGVWYDFTEPTTVELFLYKTRIRAEADYISTKYGNAASTEQQSRIYLFAERNFHIKGNHYLNLKGETAMMNSENTLAPNEMLRFGGWNSFRGFNENAFFADFYYFGGAEYRYLVGNQAFFDVFGQYGQLNNNALGLKPQLYSLGLGFNFFLPIGLMSFQISNGSEFGNPLRFSDTKIHWGILSRF